MDQIDSQCTEIRKILESGRTITQHDAMTNLGCYRLSARIHDLRNKGLDIATEQRICRNRHGKKVRFAVYRLRGACEEVESCK